MKTLNLGDTIEVRIEKLLFGGAGLARYEGRVFFVDHAAPGDLLEIEVTEIKKNFGKGRIVRILESSSKRTNPPCEVFGRCGGCQWQHLSYETQIDAKQGILQDVLYRFLREHRIELQPLLPSPKPFFYRNRIQCRVENGRVGYFAKGSHELIPIQSCLLAESELNHELKTLIQHHPKDGTYRLQRDYSTGLVSTTFIDELEEPLGFAQVNEEQNRSLQSLILSTFQEKQSKVVYDLYGGYGNLAFPLAEKYSQVDVVSVEWSRRATEMGVRLAQTRHLKNINFVNSDVDDFLNRISLISESFVIIDPPRDGCSTNVIKALAQEGPKVLVYISCDPMTWGRDSQLFLTLARQSGLAYRLVSVRGLDMFPQTDHVEVFSVFEREDPKP